MADETKMQGTVEEVDFNMDEFFEGAANAGSVTVPEGPKSVFSKNEKVDFSFADEKQNPEESDEDESGDQKESGEEVEKESNSKTSSEEIFRDLDDEDEDDEDDDQEEKPKKRGRKKIDGVGDVIIKMVDAGKLIPFDDDKPIEEYSAKDLQELIEANIEEKVNQVRQETPQQFFESLPQELQIAAKYIADGGDDLKSLFSALAQSEEKKSLDVSNERDQESIIREYLLATNFGTEDEIYEEIEMWKDLGKLEEKASKFKPKLEKMQEKILAKKLQEQEQKRLQQERASQMYMQNVYDVLKEGQLGDLKLDRKTQAMLYNGLVEPNYPSVSGNNTNLLGHLLEKYQFVEPNYTLISEALWLLSDPEGYKSKIMQKGSQQEVEKTVRKLKTEQSSKTGSSYQEEDRKSNTRSKRTIKRQATNIFKR